MSNSLEIEIESKHSAALYRKLVIAYMIDSRHEMNLNDLQYELGWPKRTIQDNVANLKSVGISVCYNGSAKSGHYSVLDWGLFDKQKVYENMPNIQKALSDYMSE